MGFVTLLQALMGLQKNPDTKQNKA
jgi:hypothetical protein